MIEIKVKSEQPIEYMSKGACAFDMRANEDVIIPAGETRMVDTGTIIEIPKEKHGRILLMLAPRSSTFFKMKLILGNSIGIIDNDYCGPTDTIKFVYWNTSKEEVRISKGDRIGQGTFIAFEKAKFTFVEKVEGKDRGGYGSTGVK